MNIKDFKRIVSTFADNPSDMLSDKNDFIIQLRDDIIQFSVRLVDYNLIVDENGTAWQAEKWIIERLAKLSMLAERINHQLPEEKRYVAPSGAYLGDIEQNPTEDTIPIENVLEKLVEVLDAPSSTSTNVVYLTSDAGEGKTTILNQLARAQAKKYIERKTTYILLPISLGGRPFLRFDDIIIASLVNKFRFPAFYYDSFIELIKLGVIVPAFDGFEEMFMESSTGEALSALGQFIFRLGSQGTMIVSARKAFFDYKSFKTQAMLFDTINTSDYVSFSRISVSRWNKRQFVEYIAKSNIAEPEKIYDDLSQILGSDNSVLTRAVLVKQLVEIIKKGDATKGIVERINAVDTMTTFGEFVRAIIEREATEKWIDKSGDISRPLISIDAHFDILGLIAQEMWTSNVDRLNNEIIEFIVDYYCEANRVVAPIARQIRERILQHALLTREVSAYSGLMFDHEEFYHYFLGIAIYKYYKSEDFLNISRIMNVNLLPRKTIESVAEQIIKEQTYNIFKGYSEKICSRENKVSFIRENIGSILITALAYPLDLECTIKLVIISHEFLDNKKLNNIQFEDCQFTSIIFDKIDMHDCKFKHCQFGTIYYKNDAHFEGCYFEDCQISVLSDIETELPLYNPSQILKKLIGFGITIVDVKEKDLAEIEELEYDDEIIQFQRVLRKFLKTTQLNDSIIKAKLGKMYSKFESDVLPSLLRVGIFAETSYDGGGIQKRYRLSKKMTSIEKAIELSNGKFNQFLEIIINME